jgi:hypothetical protein
MKEIQYKNYSKIDELKKLNKIDDQFVFQVENLTLEDLISIKLETTLRNINFKFFNFPLWHSMHKIVAEAMINSIITVAKNNTEASRTINNTVHIYQNLVMMLKLGIELNFLLVPQRSI